MAVDTRKVTGRRNPRYQSLDDLMRDADLLPRVQDAAELLLASYPDNIAALAVRWIGTAEQYGRVG